jgi:hypothetical protein
MSAEQHNDVAPAPAKLSPPAVQNRELGSFANATT